MNGEFPFSDGELTDYTNSFIFKAATSHSSASTLCQVQIHEAMTENEDILYKIQILLGERVGAAD